MYMVNKDLFPSCDAMDVMGWQSSEKMVDFIVGSYLGEMGC